MLINIMNVINNINSVMQTGIYVCGFFYVSYKVIKKIYYKYIMSKDKKEYEISLQDQKIKYPSAPNSNEIVITVEDDNVKKHRKISVPSIQDMTARLVTEAKLKKEQIEEKKRVKDFEDIEKLKLYLVQKTNIACKKNETGFYVSKKDYKKKLKPIKHIWKDLGYEKSKLKNCLGKTIYYFRFTTSEGIEILETIAKSIKELEK